jgi:hypothetical protein
MATNVNITEPPEFLKSYYAALAERGMNLGNLGFTPYDQARVAPWNAQQEAASQMVQARALGGSDAMNQAGDWYSRMLSGQLGVGNVAAPGSVGNISAQTGPQGIASGGQINMLNAPGQIGQVAATTGPSSIASGGTATAGRNAYLGMDNPYLSQAINRAQGDVSSRINSQFNDTAFGGTAHQQTLARELGNVSNQMRMQDYAAQQGLSESDVARQLATQQYNIGNANQLNQFNAGLQQQNAGIMNQMGLANAGLRGQDISNQMAVNQANAGLQGQNISNQNQLNQFNANLGMQNAGIMNTTNQFNAGLQQQNIANLMNTNQFNAGLQGQNLGRQQSALSFAPTLAANDYADAQAMMGLGNQVQGYNQQIADANYQEFLRQQQYPAQQLSYMQAGLNPAASAFKNSTTTGPDVSTAGNTMANMAGLGTLGYAAGSGLGFENPWWGALGGAALGGLL